MKIGVVKETFPGEHRVALVPTLVPGLIKAGLTVLVEAGSGTAAGFPDAQYADKGAEIVANRAAVFAAADILLQVRTLGSNFEAGIGDLELIRSGQTLIGFCDPLSNPAVAQQIAAKGATLISMEMIPRITRAQSMDALSSMATVGGYKAVLLAANALPKMFPMMMTAAGTITPAKVFVMGTGVAGLQAIASARKLGAVVSATDIRAAAKEQVESLGAKFVETPVPAAQGEGTGGYARALDEEAAKKQREAMAKVVAESDVVITTAAVPGRKAPILVTADMVGMMSPGSVLVDLAAERGGNCELTKPGQTFTTDNGVTILGPENLPATVPFHASQMYAKNITTLLAHLVKEGKLQLNTEDEITRETLIAQGGNVVHAKVRDVLGVT